MESGFVKASSDNLPRVDMEMVNEFYIDNLQFLSAEMRNEKTRRASKESYGDNAVSFVQLKRSAEICEVRCKITPEHKIHKKAYNIICVVNEQEEKVIRCQCMDCAASEGGCKHAVAFLFWLHRRSEEPSVTSTECYWKASKLSKVGSSEKYMSLSQLTGKIPPKLDVKRCDIVDAFVSTTKVEKGGVFDIYSASGLDKFDVYQVILKYKADISETAYSAESFIKYMGNIMGDDFRSVEENTRQQASCPDWYKLRFGRITASKIYEAARCKTEEGTLLESIMGASKPLQTIFISRGKELEPLVIKAVENKRNIKISKVGLLLNKNYPMLGASPDGVTKDFCIEVKCPSSEKTIENYIKNGIIAKKYYYQLQMQMLFGNKEKGLFCIASPNFENNKMVEIIEVTLNEEETKEVMELAIQFWKINVFDKLIKM